MIFEGKRKLPDGFLRLCEVYKVFSHDWRHLADYSEEMKIEMYFRESIGSPISKANGYALGKSWMGVTVSMWKEDLKKGTLLKKELYADPKFPHWWLDAVLSGC